MLIGSRIHHLFYSKNGKETVSATGVRVGDENSDMIRIGYLREIWTDASMARPYQELFRKASEGANSLDQLS